MKNCKPIELTKNMIEAGGWAHAWWRIYSDEPSDDVIASNIFKVMLAVSDGIVSLEQVKAALNPNTGYEFFQKFLVDDSN